MRLEVLSERLRSMREKVNLSQAKFAEKLGNLQQPLYARYETGSLMPSYPLLVRIADFYDVSTDYILGRTDDPRGKYYNADLLTQDERINDFIEMCFDPSTTANAKLKETLKKMIEEKNKKE